jgi:exoribonuclease R
VPTRRLAADLAPGSRLQQALQHLRDEHGVATAFPADVLAEAATSIRAPRLPAEDRTDLPLVTLDPAGARDLDQAFHLERRSAGFRVSYAIADVAAFVAPDGAIAAEAWRRVVTAYCPDMAVPLHPPAVSTQAASLLPDGPRPAVLWTLGLDDTGDLVDVEVRRALVRSRAALDYRSTQVRLDAGIAEPMLALLPEVGRLLQAQEQHRGGVSLPLPDQRVVEGPRGASLVFAAPLPVEDWNAQLSLLTGRAAARLMVAAGTGILRTMPPAREPDTDRLRAVAAGLGLGWGADVDYPVFVRSLGSATDPAVLAFLAEATSLFRGAGYVAFDGEAPSGPEHAAIAAPYAHCTAPLRRLVDRWSSELALAAMSGRRPPDWVLASMAALPAQMAEGTRRSNRLAREALDLVETAVLGGSEGQVWDAVVVDRRRDGTVEVMLRDPAVVATCPGEAARGDIVRVRLVEASLEAGQPQFVLDGTGASAS